MGRLFGRGCGGPVLGGGRFRGCCCGRCACCGGLRVCGFVCGGRSRAGRSFAARLWGCCSAGAGSGFGAGCGFGAVCFFVGLTLRWRCCAFRGFFICRGVFCCVLGFCGCELHGFGRSAWGLLRFFGAYLGWVRGRSVRFRSGAWSWRVRGPGPRGGGCGFEACLPWGAGFCAGACCGCFRLGFFCPVSVLWRCVVAGAWRSVRGLGGGRGCGRLLAFCWCLFLKNPRENVWRMVCCAFFGLCGGGFGWEVRWCASWGWRFRFVWCRTG
ncbi:hypothetical protein SAMN02745168_2236 [Papillibacter cinnamivorans DSM 12816]|uniref:Uncharacterized protein n=1 Tax=Papillibacter cinnamivorans DSM 12816 TaxID=1122930 RepID=A0A1W2BIV9_9FIRM|nr:hypothetical protein SAMN02745168_2236 [Papillibacter cinnamivorans DSM 12816]